MKFFTYNINSLVIRGYSSLGIPWLKQKLMNKQDRTVTYPQTMSPQFWILPLESQRSYTLAFTPCVLLTIFPSLSPHRDSSLDRFLSLLR